MKNLIGGANGMLGCGEGHEGRRMCGDKIGNKVN